MSDITTTTTALAPGEAPAAAAGDTLGGRIRASLVAASTMSDVELEFRDTALKDNLQLLRLEEGISPEGKAAFDAVCTLILGAPLPLPGTPGT